MGSFEINLENLVEHEDGSCTVTLNMSIEATRWLLEIALQKVLMDAVNALEQEAKDAPQKQRESE
jgi:hypothetical protein